MIFRILDLLSNSHAAVVNGRAFEFEPSRIAITSEHFIDNCLHASCSILCAIHSADETQSGRNSCPEFAINWLSVRTLSCCCPVKAFHFYVVSALQFIVVETVPGTQENGSPRGWPTSYTILLLIVCG